MTGKTPAQTDPSRLQPADKPANRAALRRIRGRGLLLAWLLPLMLLISGCQAILPSTPRLATIEARTNGQGSAEPTSTPMLVAAPTPTGEPLPTPVDPADQIQPNPVLTLWVNETSIPHREVLQQMQAELDDKYGVFLEFVMINEDQLPALVQTAVLSGTLPDLILHPLEYTMGWTQEGVLDPQIANNILGQLGRETFDPAALDLVALADGRTTAIPNDGAPQLLLYRQDWFDALDLEPPTSYETILAGSAEIYRSETLSGRTGISNTLISGLVVPTESDLVRTQQVFEQLALANGCNLIDEKGEVLLLHPDCLDALDFYRELVNSFSPSDIQTNISALNAYLAGRTGMIFTSPSALVALAGLDEDYRPTCPECAADDRYLSSSTGFVTTISGRSPAAETINFSNLTYLGFTRRADPELAALFAAYWFDEGYLNWIAVEPERKIPLRLGTADAPRQFRDSWFDLPLRPGSPTLADIYGRELLVPLVDSVSAAARWGFRAGQGALMTELYEASLFSIVLQEMLSGYFSSSQAIIEAYQRVVDLIPNYNYIIEPLPTPVGEDSSSDEDG